MAVLMLTQQLDPTADHVIAQLNAKRIAVFRFDSAEFPLHLSVSAELGAGGWMGTMRSPLRELRLSDVTGIYYRRPTAFRFPPEMTDAERSWAAAEARMGVGGLLSAMTHWLNHPARIAAAEFKPVQLGAAIRAGLRVPRTMITNVPADVVTFADSMKSVIYKPLAAPYFEQDGERQFIYASPVARQELPDPAIGLTSHLFQEWIEHEYAVRLTVVGQRLFASAIYADSAPAHVDWRSDYSALTYAIIDIPEPVRHGVLRLMRDLGLSFGALDFLVTSSGDWVFLEINPNGQWAWIEEETGLPIAEAVANVLTGQAI